MCLFRRPRLVVRVGDAPAEFVVVAEVDVEVLRQVRGFSDEADELSLAEVELRRQEEGR